ncbi:relA-associated inhibitor-like [Corythoichthys intestinalis]|uniref:relA-associated inhibitor-like n=1 Tax=Corythoichthys intestinalis TaxID=161448 RepID=UPI0025A5A888|nr:relA-associated inhibitor-like [Corythoichthys intestinalis]XP_061797575.1 relA-associated inhibitor-like [Nerophis lumbriciformis]
MTSQSSYGSSLLFQTMNDDLNASLANADELASQFDSMLRDASGSKDKQREYKIPHYNIPPLSTASDVRSNWTNISPTSTSTLRSMDVTTTIKSTPTSPAPSVSPLSSPRIARSTSSLPRGASDGYSYQQISPKHSPHSPRRSYDHSPRRSPGYAERSPSPGHAPASHLPLPSPNRLSPFDGRRSPRPDRGPSPLSFHHPVAETLPRAFAFRQSDEGVQRQKSPSKWNETDLDMSFESKPHHTYDKSEWIRTSVPNSNWRESNLDGPPPAPGPKKNHRAPPVQFPQGSLSRNTRVTVLPEVASSNPSHQYHQQPIISRISIPPIAAQSRQRRPIPLSVIMRLQNPQWGAMSPRTGPPGDPWETSSQPATSRNFFSQAAMHPPPELRQPAIYSDALNPGDIDAELSRLDIVHHIAQIQEGEPSTPQGPPRPLSPTRLQPVVAPEAQSQEIPDLEELLRIRSEIPRPLKRRGSVDQSRPLQRASHYEPNQYKKLINKLFRRKEPRHKGERGSERGSETSTSSEEEEIAAVPLPQPPPTSTLHDFRNYHSILRASRDRKSSGRRARLSPLVLALDGALVGELETVQRAVQEMPDPSQSNDEGITALHNAICGGHYNVVDFLVRIGANVSAPDSHGWTPLHCAASCNDRLLCEFLVRNGAAVMAITESDGATAAQKCDPYAVGFEECETFLRGREEAMGIENSGVLYALWSYPAQAPDELTFREGDMVTILQKHDGSDWWWASLCGREGFVPNNYFGLFPKVRPKSLS